MKKIFWPILAVAMAAGVYVAVACSKDTEKAVAESTKDAKCIDEKPVVVGYSERGSSDIVSLVPKEKFLDWLDVFLNSKEAGLYVVEDFKMWNQPYGEEKCTPIMSVSFFDVVEEVGNTLYIQMEVVSRDDQMLYAVGGGSNNKYCGGTCNSCYAHLDWMGNLIDCICLDPKPTFKDSKEEAEWIRRHTCQEKEPSARELLRAIVDFFYDIFH